MSKYTDTSELRFGSVQNLYLELETRPLTEPFRIHLKMDFVLVAMVEITFHIAPFFLNESCRFKTSSDFFQVIHYISIGILSIFMIEIAVKIFAFRLDFFKSKMEVFDAIIVVVSFVLDIVYASAEGVESAVGLIIILRLWRVTRILNGKILLYMLCITHDSQEWYMYHIHPYKKKQSIHVPCYLSNQHRFLPSH